jgi:outer membrane cobalamin receptor
VRSKTLLAAIVLQTVWVQDSSAQEVDLEVPVLVIEKEAEAPVDQPETDLTQLVLSAAKRVQTVQDSASIVTVVTRNQMLVRGYQNLSDVLDDVPGYEGYRPAFYLDSPDAFARGNGRTVLVLWNGVPLNSPETNQRVLGPYLPIGVMDRIEVISGPGGVLWGANAVLGVASITTMRGGRETSNAEVSGSIGGGPEAAGAYRASATVAGSLWGKRVEVYANLDLITSLGPILDPPYDIQITPFPAPDNDGTVQLGRSSGTTHNERDLWLPLTLALDVGDFSLDVLYPIIAREFREFNDAGARTDQVQYGDGPLTPGPSSQRAENVTVASLQYNRRLSERSRVVSRAYWTGFEDRWVTLVKYAPGLLSPNPIVTNSTYTGMNPYLHDGAYRGGATVDFSRTGDSSQLIGGAEVYLEGVREVRQELIGGLIVGQPWVHARPGKRVVTSVYVDDRVDLSKRFSIDAGARGQFAPGAYDPLLLGSLAARWNLYRKVNLKLNATQGFRPPPLALINGNDDPMTNPYPHRESNPDLRAERSLSVEGELSALVLEGVGRMNYAALRLGYQFTRLEDLVVFDASGAPANANRRDMSSIEARADVALAGGHRIVVGYSFLRGIDEQNGPIRNIPAHRLHLSLEAHVATHVSFYLGTAVTGAVEDLDRLAVPTSATGAFAPPASVIVDHLPPSGLVNAGVVAAGLLGGSCDVALHVQNVFDAKHYIADPDFERRQAIIPMAAAGVSAYLSLTWRM